MKRIEVTGKIFSLVAGRVILSPEQAHGRSSRIRQVETDSDVYEIIGPIEFRQGEIFGYDGEITPKMSRLAVVIPESVAVEEVITPDMMKVAEITAELDALKVDYPKGAKKADLVVLLTDARNAAQGGGSGPENEG